MSNKRKIGLYRVLSRLYFYLPVLVAYLCLQGFTILSISMIMAIYGMAALFITQIIPYCKLQNKTKLMLSELAKLIGLLLLIGGQGIVWIGMAQIFMGVSYGVGAGADSKLIYEHVNEPEQFQRKSNGWMFLAVLFSGFIGFLLFKLDHTFPFWASLVTTVMTLILCLSMPTDLDLGQTIPESRGYRAGNKAEYRAVIFAYAGMKGIILTLFTTFLPYLLFVQMDIQGTNFIFMLMSYTIAGNITSRFANKLDIKWNFFLLLVVLVMYLSETYVFMMIATIIMGAVSGTLRPITFASLRDQGLSVEVGAFLMERQYALINILLLIAGGMLYFFYHFQAVIFANIFVNLLLLFLYLNNK